MRDNVYMLVGAGGNTTIYVGSDGIMVVDTQFAPLSTKILNAIRAISNAPIRYVVNTHVHGDHIGGNEAISKAGRFRAGGNVVGDLGAAATATAAIIAHENVLKRLSADPAPGQTQVPFALVADRDLHHQAARVPVQRRGRPDHPRAERPHRRRQRGLLPEVGRAGHGRSLHDRDVSRSSTSPTAARSMATSTR